MEFISSNIAWPSQWCEIPTDILLKITKMSDEVHILRLRAVCISWRSCLPLRNLNTALQIPNPIPFTSPSGISLDIDDSSLSKRFVFNLVHTSIYLVSTLSGTLSGIVRLDLNALNICSISHPLSGVKFPFNPDEKNHSFLNLLDFRFTELTKAYTLSWVDTQGSYHTHPCSPYELDKHLLIKKIVLCEDLKADGEPVTAVLAILAFDLAVWKPRFEDWTRLATKNKYVDAICYRGRFYCICISGLLSVIDPLSMFRIMHVSNVDMNGSWYENRVQDYFLGIVDGHLYRFHVVLGFRYYDRNDNYEVLLEYMRCFEMKDDDDAWIPIDDNSLVNEAVLFWGMDVTFSVSAKCLDWPTGNYVICASDSILDIHVGIRRPSSLCKNMDIDMDMESSEQWRACYFRKNDAYEYTHTYGYDMHDHRLSRIGYRDQSLVRGCEMVFWPPPTWLVLMPEDRCQGKFGRPWGRKDDDL